MGRGGYAWVAATLFACGTESQAPVPDPAPMRAGDGISFSEADDEEVSPQDSPAYGECRWRHYSECGGKRPVCFFSSGDGPRWSVCSQRCDEDADCLHGPDDGTAPVRCKPIIVHPPPPGACVLDCGDGQTCPEGMICDPRLGICGHPDGGPLPV